MSEQINPVEYGALRAEVAYLQKTVSSLQDDVKLLIELANKGKGGIWMGMTIVSSLSAIAAWIAAHMSLAIK